jgi:predicted component of type VI protein secretion system
VRFWLRFGDHDVELPPGEVVIGRSPKCQLVIDDPLISRQHAKLSVGRQSVTIEDMGSVNGVLVNGNQLNRAQVLASGDRIVIGQQTFALHAAKVESEGQARVGRMTLSQASREDLGLSLVQEDSERNEATRQGDALEMLTGVVEKVLALGRGEEAERILGNYLRVLLQTARVQNRIDPVVAEKAVTYATRIAEATGKGGWVDYAFEVYTVLNQPLPAPVVERLYASLRAMSPINLGIFRRYLSGLKAAEGTFGPSERFLLRRLSGLEPLILPK